MIILDLLIIGVAVFLYFAIYVHYIKPTFKISDTYDKTALIILTSLAVLTWLLTLLAL